MEIGAIIGGVIGGAITVVGYFYITRWLNQKADERERRREENGKLKRHLEELKRKVGNPTAQVTSHITQHQGKLEIFDAVDNFLSYSSFTSSLDFEAGEQFESFEMHFPDLATQWQELKRKINEHNNNLDRFKQEIEQSFESFPGINNTVFEPLFNCWQELAENRQPRPDFRQIEPKLIQESYKLYASGWGESPVAVVSTQDDIEKYKKALIEVVESEEYQDKAGRIHVSASNIVKELGEFASELGDTINDISRYWPSNRFTTLKSCPICQKF